MKVLWWTKTLWKRTWGLDKCVQTVPNGMIDSPYINEPGASYGAGAWDPIVFTQNQANRIKDGRADAQSIIQNEYPGAVFTSGNNANYPGCGSAMQCKKR